MIEEAWDGTIVSRHTVDVTIGEVRKSLGEFGVWIVNRPKLGHRIDVPKSDELVRRGWHFWHRRTREGFNRAIECFEQAATRDAIRSPTFVGLSESYLALGDLRHAPAARHVPALPRSARARGGARRPTPELRCDRAHALICSNVGWRTPRQSSEGHRRRLGAACRPTSGSPASTRRRSETPRRSTCCAVARRSTRSCRCYRPPKRWCRFWQRDYEARGRRRRESASSCIRTSRSHARTTRRRWSSRDSSTKRSRNTEPRSPCRPT